MLRLGIMVLFLSLSMVLSAGPGIAGQTIPTDDTNLSAKATAPKVAFPVRKHDFGEVFEGTEIKYDFVVENHGNAPLVITNIRPG